MKPEIPMPVGSRAAAKDKVPVHSPSPTIAIIHTLVVAKGLQCAQGPPVRRTLSVARGVKPEQEHSRNALSALPH